MSSTSNQIFKDFQYESENLLIELLALLEKCEGEFSQVQSLEKYGQIVDRIMGGSKSLQSESGEKAEIVKRIADVSALCKAVGYKTAQIKDDPVFYNACVAILFDATEVLKELFESIDDGQVKNPVMSVALVERLRWISSKFSDQYAESIDRSGGKQDKLNQSEIDDLMKKMGL